MLSQVFLNPIVSLIGEQYLEIEPVQFVNHQNLQSNVVYCILPENDAQCLQAIYILPANELQNPLEQDNMASVKGNTDEDEFILVQNQFTQSNLHNVHQPKTLYNYEPVDDPPSIPENVSYPISKPYNEVQDTSENSTKYNEWHSQITCDNYPECKVFFSSNNEKKIHMDDHKYPANTTFKCSICNMVFSSAIERNQHIETHSVPDTYKCDECFKRFPYYTSYVQHLHDDNCTPNRSSSCCYCDFQFPCAEDVQRHQELNTKICECKTKFCSNEAFYFHRYSCIQFKRKLNSIFRKTELPVDVIVLD